MFKLTISRVSANKYQEILCWCNENIEGFEELPEPTYDVYVMGVFLNVIFRLPTKEDMVYFMVVWQGHLDNG